MTVRERPANEDCQGRKALMDLPAQMARPLHLKDLQALLVLPAIKALKAPQGLQVQRARWAHPATRAPQGNQSQDLQVH